MRHVTTLATDWAISHCQTCRAPLSLNDRQWGFCGQCDEDEQPLRYRRDARIRIYELPTRIRP